MDDDEGYLGVDLRGRQPKFTEGVDRIGHNSEAVVIGRIKSTIDSLVKLEEKHEEALQVLTDNQEDEREVMLLVLGRQLLEGRKRKSKENYGKWVSCNFPNLQDTVNANEQSAILWAAEFPEQHQQLLEENPRVKTTRGLHEKWKKSQKPTGETGGGSGENSGSGSSSDRGADGGDGEPSKPPQGNSDNGKPNKGKGGINTDNPDTTVAKADATMIASSLIGVVTNMLMFEQTQGRAVEEHELSSAIFNEIRGQSADKLSQAEVERFVEQKLKRTLRTITNSLPVLNGSETNVVRINKAMENSQ